MKEIHLLRCKALLNESFELFLTLLASLLEELQCLSSQHRGPES
uniref:Uncharacterized protein n=1 Tax=Lepeophtheirus salmonis TaxID=72036 RepID=A0A0K2TU01_LEPSM